MIQLLPPLTLDGRFSAQDLPDALQLPLLNSMAVPRIVSSSMAPTIQAGDRLELRPPAALTIGSDYRDSGTTPCSSAIVSPPLIPKAGSRREATRRRVLARSSSQAL